MGAKSFSSGVKNVGSSVVGRMKSLLPAKLEKSDSEDEGTFVSNYLKVFGSKRTAKLLRSNLKMIRDSLVNTFETAKLVKLALGDIVDGLKTKGRSVGGGGILGGLGGIVGLIGGLTDLLTNPIVLALLAAGSFLALLNNPKLREAVFKFIGESSSTIVGYLWNNIKALLPKWITDTRGAFRDNVITGGEEYSKKHDELDQRLIDAGMNTKGIAENRSRQEMRTSRRGGRTEEQQKIFEEVEAEREKVNSLSSGFNKRKDESLRSIRLRRMKNMPQELKDMMNDDPFNPKLSAYNRETRRQVLEAEKKIRLEENNKIKNLNSIEVDQSKLIRQVDELSKTDGSASSNTNIVPFDTSFASRNTSGGGDGIVPSTSGGGNPGVRWIASSNFDAKTFGMKIHANIIG
tara:strand:+ start:332 stop:1543 length:1212 start_codon:yes stop_codon:yes gene_type:complete